MPKLLDSLLKTKTVEVAFSFEVDANIIETIAKVVSEATDCKEFQEHCNSEIEKGLIPTKLLEMWMYGSKHCETTINNTFLDYVKTELIDFQEEKLFLCLDKLDKDVAESNQDYAGILASGTRIWSLEENESLNDDTMYDYLPGQTLQIPPAIHALLTHMAFDNYTYEKHKEFALVLSTQPPVNNRDFSMAFAKPDDNKKPGMFDYVTFKEGTASEKNTKLQIGIGHYMLAKRVRREDVEDSHIKNILSPYTTMFNIQQTTQTNISRFEGVKLVGDPVGISCPYEDMCDLFTTLTVSKLLPPHSPLIIN